MKSCSLEKVNGMLSHEGIRGEVIVMMNKDVEYRSQSRPILVGAVALLWIVTTAQFSLAETAELAQPWSLVLPGAEGDLPTLTRRRNETPLAEPPGEAILVDDSEGSDTGVTGARFALATTPVEVAPTRAAELLASARQGAVVAKSAGDLNDVIEQCRRALDENPNTITAKGLHRLAAWASNRRGELLAKAGDDHAAFEQFQNAITHDPACWEALHNRGVTLARYSQTTDALADFNQVVLLAPQFSVARQNRGEIHRQLGRWKDAIADYTVAIERTPNDAMLYAARGHAWRQLGNTHKAANDYGQAIQLDGTLAEAYAGRGNLFAGEGYFEQAVEDFKKALEYDARSAVIYKSVAWLLSTCPQSEFRSRSKGLEAADRVRQLMGEEDPMVLDLLAAAHANAGKFREAIAFEQRAILLAGVEENFAFKQRLELYRSGKPFRTPKITR